MGAGASELRLSNAAKYDVIVCVHDQQANKDTVFSLAVELKQVGKVSAEFSRGSKNYHVRQVVPGMMTYGTADTLPWRVEKPYVTILMALDEGCKDVTWICTNYTPPPNRCIIVKPTGKLVMAKKGKHWTEENGRVCYFPHLEV